MKYTEEEIKEVISFIGKRIKDVRKERKLSQRKLALLCDMDPSPLRNIEKGKGNPTVKTLYRIAASLDISLNDLIPKKP